MARRTKPLGDSHGVIELARKRFQTLLALRRAGEPDEIIGAALYFASDASSFTSGAILRVDGGQM